MIIKPTMWALLSTESQVIHPTDTAVIQKRQVAGSVYWFRYFYAKLLGLSLSILFFNANLVILHVHEFAVILLYQQGEAFTGEVADCRNRGNVSVPVLFGIQVNFPTFVIPVCRTLWGAIPIVFIHARYCGGTKKKQEFYQPRSTPHWPWQLYLGER